MTGVMSRKKKKNAKNKPAENLMGYSPRNCVDTKWTLTGFSRRADKDFFEKNSRSVRVTPARSLYDVVQAPLM
jgi:hypothetical protein